MNKSIAKSDARVTPVETLGARIREIRKSLGLSQGAFGISCGVSQVAVSRWEADKDVPTPKTLLELASRTGDDDLKLLLSREAGVSAAQAYLQAADSSNWRMVKLLRDPVAAGTPRVTDETEIEALVPFPRTTFRPGGELYVLKVVGESMSPIVPDGYKVVVDTSQREAKNLVHRMVAAREGDGVGIKWLRQDQDTFMLVPQHTSIDYPVRIMRPDGDFSIVGAVVYIMGEPPPIRR